MSIGKILFHLSGFFIAATLSGQVYNSSLLDNKIDISKGDYSLEEILNKLENETGYSITYNSNELPLNSIINIDPGSPSLGKLLELIEEQAFVQYQIKNSYIILRNKRNISKYTLQGYITDKETGESLVGANIFIPKDFIGSISDIQGHFSLRIPPGDYLLSVSYMGYEKKQLNLLLNEDKQLNIELEPVKVLIGEVNIVSQKNYFGNLNAGRSIASIDAEEFDNMNMNNVADILHAREPGVWTTKTSGAPGDHERIRIRGIHSIYSAVDPLYVVDGVPIPNINIASLGVNDINIHDIERVTILKDISSAAIYGFQGGNGVVMIDTKKGNENSVNFTSRFGVQQFNKFYSLMNTKQFLSTINAYSAYHDPALNIYYPAYSDTLSDTNWQKEFFHPGVVQEYLLSLSGSPHALHYYFSGSYFNQQGVIANSAYTKYTFLMNLGSTFYKRITIGLNYHTGMQLNSNNLDTYMGNSQVLRAIDQSPCANSTPDSLIYNLSGQPFSRTYYPYSIFLGRTNADSLFQQNSKKLNINSHSASVSINVHLAKNLYLDASGSLCYRKHEYESKASLYWNGDYKGYLANHEKYYYTSERLFLLYSNDVGKHEFSFAGGIRSYRDRAVWETDSADANFSYSSGIDELFIRNSLIREGAQGDINRKINSLVGNFTYTFNKKYTLSIASDYDRLEEGKFSRPKVVFPSLAINWDLSREPFINQLNWIDLCNIYVNWGKAGNFPLSTLAGGMFESIPYVFGDSLSGAPSSLSLVTNYRLKHEEMEEFNYGLHFSALDKRIEVDANFFKRYDRNLIVQGQLPDYAGGGSSYLNIAQMDGSGKEFGLELIPVYRSKITWFTRIGYSQFHQVVRKLNSDKEIPFNNTDALIPSLLISEGQELGNIIGYKYLGVWTKEDAQNQSSQYFETDGLKYWNYDTTSSSKTPNDRVIIGNSIPDYTWSWYNSFTMKQFSFDFLWYAVIGFSKYNATRASTYMAGVNSDLINMVNDSVNAFSHLTVYESSFFVEDASFIRLKYITLSYHPSRKLWKSVDLSLSLSLENLITITSYTGYDPEATIYTGNSFTDNAVDRGAYPSPKAAYVSIALKF
jgi:TonB-dependent starch-binding outer membrane protein SusC